MKLHFEPNLDYQHAAIESVCDLFKGQEICRSAFTVTRDAADQQQRMGFAENDIGIGNRLTLLDDDLLKNLNDIQLRNGLPPSSSLASGDFTVEMETGTGKTYVYLRTVFELNQRYGFNKFVIVVPSVAIKEGVYKSLQMMEGRFQYREGFEDVWLGDEHFDLRERKKARLCLKYLVDHNAFDEGSARHFVDEIDPYVREQGDYLRAVDVKIDHYFNDLDGRLIKFRRDLIRAAGRNGRFYLRTN